MRLYRIVQDGEATGFASISGPYEDRELEGFRPATRYEYAWWYAFRERFSYVDLAGIALSVGIWVAYDLDWFYIFPITFIVGVIGAFIESATKP